MSNKEKLRRQFCVGTRYFLDNIPLIKTSIYHKFTNEVVDPLHKVLSEEFEQTENPQTAQEIQKIQKIVAQFGGFIVRVKDLPTQSVNNNGNEQDDRCECQAKA